MKKEPVKIVVHYAGGRIVKGTTLNFHPDRPTFLLQPVGASSTDPPVLVALRELKAVFFVRDFAGDPKYTDRKEFERPPVGRQLTVTFNDGEVVVGSSVSYDADKDGFFLVPADPRSNNERIYVVKKSVRGVERSKPQL